MKVNVWSKNKDVSREVTLPDLFEKKPNLLLIKDYIRYILALKRMPIASTLNRGEVRGGGKKPWKQKGTGNARVGSNRSPLWVGGGVTFGPTSDANFKLSMPSKMKSAAREQIFANFAQNKRLIIIESITVKDSKTKTAVTFLEQLEIEGKISLLLSTEEMKQALGFRNLPFIHLMSKDLLDIVNLVSSDYLIMTKAALEENFIKGKNE